MTLATVTAEHDSRLIFRIKLPSSPDNLGNLWNGLLNDSTIHHRCYLLCHTGN